jgi:crossover junction endodeoxyribonuclease RuvC
MRVLCVDPGFETTGYAVIETTGRRLSVLDAGTIKSNPRHSLERRLVVIYDGMVDVLRECAPATAAIEDVYSGPYPLAGLRLSHVRAVSLLALGQAELKVTSYKASTVKGSITGRGTATKEQVQRMMEHLVGTSLQGQPFDVSDALAIAYCHALRLNLVTPTAMAYPIPA